MSLVTTIVAFDRLIKVGTTTFKPSVVEKDGYWVYKGEKLVAHDPKEELKKGRHPGKDVKISDEVIAALVDWDVETRKRYGKGIVYMANYGIDLAERSRVDTENRLSQRKVSPLEWLSTDATDADRAEFARLLGTGKKMADAAQEIYDARPDAE